jgi:hypothetical protein
MSDEMVRVFRALAENRTIGALYRAADRFCRRTNDGLLAVAVVLALAVLAILVNRNTELIMPSCDSETGICIDVHLNLGP